MSVLSSYARRHYESSVEQEIRSLTKAISISCCGELLSELMNKTKGPGRAASSESSSQIKNQSGLDRLSRQATEEQLELRFFTSQCGALQWSIQSDQCRREKKNMHVAIVPNTPFKKKRPLMLTANYERGQIAVTDLTKDKICYTLQYGWKHLQTNHK